MEVIRQKYQITSSECVISNEYEAYGSMSDKIISIEIRVNIRQSLSVLISELISDEAILSVLISELISDKAISIEKQYSRLYNWVINLIHE